MNEDAHEPLTTLDDWTAAQHAPTPRRANGEYPLSGGLVQCGECGAGLVGQLATHAQTRRTYRRMRCAACARCSISADGLEAGCARR